MIEADIEDNLLLFSAKALREAAVGLLAIMSSHADCNNLNLFEVYYISGMHSKCHIFGGGAQTITLVHGCLEPNSLILWGFCPFNRPCMIIQKQYHHVQYACRAQVHACKNLQLWYNLHWLFQTWQLASVKRIYYFNSLRFIHFITDFGMIIALYILLHPEVFHGNGIYVPWTGFPIPRYGR